MSSSFFSLPQLLIVKVVDIFLRKPMAPLGQIPGDCNNPLVCLTFVRRCYLGILLSVLPNDESNKGSLCRWTRWHEKYLKNHSHVILNEGAFKEILEIQAADYRFFIVLHF